MTDEEMKWSNATGKMVEFVFRIELYTRDSGLGWELRQMSQVGTVALGKGEESTTLWAGMEEEGHWGDVLSAYLLLHGGSDADAIPVEWTQPEVGVSCVREGVRPRWPCSNTRSPSGTQPCPGRVLEKPTVCVVKICLPSMPSMKIRTNHIPKYKTSHDNLCDYFRWLETTEQKRVKNGKQRSRKCWCGLLLYMKVYNLTSYFL